MVETFPIFHRAGFIQHDGTVFNDWFWNPKANDDNTIYDRRINTSNCSSYDLMVGLITCVEPHNHYD